MTKKKITLFISIVLILAAAGVLSACSSKKESGQQAEKTTTEAKKSETERLLEELTLEEKVAQMFFITPEQLTGYGQVVQAGETTKKALEQYPVGGLILFAQNIENDEQLKNMMADLKQINDSQRSLPLFLAIDEEGGEVARIANSGKCQVEKTPYISQLGKKGKEDVEEAASYIGSYLKEYGFNVNFAPVADISNENTAGILKNRTFASDPNTVAECVTAYLKRLEGEGILGTVKHFPGQGSVKQDTHVESGYIEKSFEEMMDTDLVPFKKAIEANVSLIMVSHMVPGGADSKELPSSMNQKVVKDLLREEMGYENLVITDAFNMEAISNHYSSSEAAVQAIQAGVDIILMPADFTSAYAGVLQAVKDGTISEKRIDESVERIIQIKMKNIMG